MTLSRGQQPNIFNDGMNDTDLILQCSLVAGGLEGKYRVAAPELMQDTFMSDSEDEGGEPIVIYSDVFKAKFI